MKYPLPVVLTGRFCTAMDHAPKAAVFIDYQVVAGVIQALFRAGRASGNDGRFPVLLHGFGVFQFRGVDFHMVRSTVSTARGPMD